MVRRRRSRTVFETHSALSGRVRVIDHGRERRLIVSGDTLSVYPLDGDWLRLREEYWWQAVTAAPRRPRALLVGLGGGTQIHLLSRLVRPRLMTVIERDPAIMRVAHDWFALRRVGGIEFLCGDATRLVPWLARAGRRFDFVMDDAAYADATPQALSLAWALVPLVAPRGVLVLNRHERHDARRAAAALRPLFRQVRVQLVRRSAENALVLCQAPRQQRTPGRG
jgi:protein-L-isoaspartate O-methyltransferase